MAVTLPVDDLYRAAIRLHQQGRVADAAALYDRILAAQPRHAGALHLKGVLALQRGAYDEAVTLIEQSLRLLPRNALALSNLAVALRAVDRMLDAIAALQESLALDPDSADAWTNLAQTQYRAGFTADAIVSAKRASTLKPERLDSRSFMLFGANNLAEIDPLVMTEEARDYGQIVERLHPPRTRHPNDRDPDRPLRVGLVSGDLRSHPVGRFLEAVLGALDPSRILIYVYDDTEKTDELSARLKPHAVQWRRTRGLPDAALAAQIAEDGIDILGDLSGHTGEIRLPAFALRPAPVAFTWLGYFATTGLTAIDYVLANRWVVPPAEENQWTEKVWRLPETYLCFTAPRDASLPAPLPALARGAVTFGSFNNFNKLSNATLAAWGHILARLPSARLILRSSGPSHEGVRANLERRLAGQGADLVRVRIDSKISNYADHLRSYDEIDIALDPFPYNGGTTTVEALYMGVPVVVRAGDRYVSHMGESILHNAGLSDWIAPDASAYVDLALQKAADLGALAALRAGLRDRMLASPLFDAPRFARNLEAAWRGMWQTWCATQT